MITLNNISVTFGKGSPLETTVFEDFNLLIKSGEFVTVIGGNGAGKSTLMNLISGDILSNSGSIVLDNIAVTKWPTHKRARLISRVFQDPLLGSYADLTIEENLNLAFSRGKSRTLKMALSASLREQFRERLSHMALNLENRLNDKMGLLSGGQRQAVSLVMATLRPSKILLLDEHTAALDPKMEGLILELTQRLIQEKQLTALMITHSMSQALELGTRTLMMHHGKIVRDLQGEERNQLQAKDLVGFF
ncbi:MAG TPA: ATP-binding cassette domain-containing protein [Gammaproteobacteria bacterium]|nr:ATP-binding cassette domain-containing protein [Gammaproteobacteria bacterium]